MLYSLLQQPRDICTARPCFIVPCLYRALKITGFLTNGRSVAKLSQAIQLTSFSTAFACCMSLSHFDSSHTISNVFTTIILAMVIWDQ